MNDILTRFSRKKCSRIIQARRASSGSIKNIGTIVRSHIFYTTDDFYATSVCFYGSSLNIRWARVTISGKFPNKEKKKNDDKHAWSTAAVRQNVASVDKVLHF